MRTCTAGRPSVFFTAIPLPERMAIQSDLVWTGDYNGTINGEFGERAKPSAVAPAAQREDADRHQREHDAHEHEE